MKKGKLTQRMRLSFPFWVRRILEHKQNDIPDESDYSQEDYGWYAVQINIFGFNPGGIGEQYT